MTKHKFAIERKQRRSIDLRSKINPYYSKIRNHSNRLLIQLRSKLSHLQISTHKFIFAFALLLIAIITMSRASNTAQVDNSCSEVVAKYNNQTLYYSADKLKGYMGVQIDTLSCEVTISYLTIIDILIPPNPEFAPDPYLGYLVEHSNLQNPVIQIGLGELLPIFQNEDQKFDFQPSKFDTLGIDLAKFYGLESQDQMVTSSFYHYYIYKTKFASIEEFEAMFENNIYSIWNGQDFVFMQAQDNGQKSLKLDINQAYRDAPKIREYNLEFKALN